MPWRKMEPMEERLKLIADRLAGYSITELLPLLGKEGLGRCFESNVREGLFKKRTV
jgi:hypothetical protein